MKNFDYLLIVIVLSLVLSCDSKKEFNVVQKTGKFDLDTLKIGRGREIDTNQMMAQHQQMIGVISGEYEYTVENYKVLNYTKVSKQNIAKSISSKINIKVDSVDQQCMTYYGLIVYQSEGNYINEYSTKSLPVYIKNISDEILKLHTPNGSLRLLTEAKDRQGKWKPIEYMVIDKFTYQKGNYINGKYLGEGFFLLPGFSLIILSEKFEGNFKTELRMKLFQDNETIYSNVFEGSIYEGYFDLPKSLKSTTESYLVVLK